jgi:cell division protein FtsZ
MFEYVDSNTSGAVIRVIGVGGGGGNAVDHMVANNLNGVEFFCANTDSQALARAICRNLIQLGSHITKGLGAGANPETGRQAAVEDRDRIEGALKGADMVFIAAGMGGGTGTGGAPIVAQVARELGILTVAVVTRPFPFEGKRRAEIATQGIEELKKYVDSLIIIPNEKLLTTLGKDFRMTEAFKMANDVLRGAVQGIADLITTPGFINVDFADVRTVMSEMGMAMMGSGEATGPNRALEAAEMAISSPLLEDIELSGARGILVNVTAGNDITVGEFEQVGNRIRELAADDATVVTGMAIDENMTETLKVTVVATGLGHRKAVKHEKPVLVVNSEPTISKRVVGSDITYGNKYDQPTHTRRQTESKESGRNANSYDPILDIPAFLRRQAD